MASQGSANRLARWVQDNRLAVAALAAAAVAAGAYYYASPARPRGGAGAGAADEADTGSSIASKKKKGKKSKKSTKSSATGPVLDDADDEALVQLSDAELQRLPAARRESVAQYLKGKGNKAYSNKKFEDALADYTKAIAAQPSAVFYSNRAACYANLGKPEEVIKDCNEALKIDKTYIKALNRRAVAAEQLGEAASESGEEGNKARASLERSLADFTAVAILGQFRDATATASVERVLKKLASGKALLIMRTRTPRLPSATFVTAYLEAFRPEPRPQLTDSNKAGDKMLGLAYDALDARDYYRALDLCGEAIELGCSTNELQAAALNLRGTFMFVIGLAGRAQEDLDKSTELCPDYVQSWVKKASVHTELGDKDQTFRDFDRAIKIDPNNPDIYYHRGQVNFILGDYEAAIADYEKSTSLDDKFIFSHVQNAVANYKLGNVAHSTAIFRRILKAFPNSSESYNYYGELLLDQQRHEDAISNFDKSIALERADAKSTNVLPMINKALVLFQWKQDLNSAEQLCRDALKIDPDCDVAIATLAQLSLQQSKIPEAIEYFRRSADIARTEPELVNAITYEHASRAQLEFIRDYPQQGAALSQMASSLV
ncbi:TOM (translocase of outer membrane) complex component [Malassezia vespertilionis]|uniref:Tom70p n=1 Tax=Malassezia vespertilionis TaxID=2020962 RepID=A0A2N1JB76_9BASI|nr:TOM (translocase of outer membrane) complex component [Malassezia vespertilionis]PKI83762.1 Tom70p [Malassezia vespertilionis]WFD07162.1 TOM (translocase of outer membrane) complex component [Malassezia vespertilionis]